MFSYCYVAMSLLLKANVMLSYLLIGTSLGTTIGDDNV